MRNSFVRVPLALLALVSQVVAQAAPVIGLAVLNDGKRVEAASEAYEYTALRFDSGTYQITLPDGRKWAGLSAQVRKRIDYREPPRQKTLQEMEACARAYPKSAGMLATRIEGMRKDLENMALDAQLAGLPAKKETSVMIGKLNFKGREYTNIRATSLQGGKLGFTHDAGSFSVPAIVLNHALLQQIKRTSPDIAGKIDFENLSATFMEKLEVAGRAFTGVRLLSKDGDLWTVQSNSGNQKVKSTDLTEQARKDLDSKFQRTQRLIQRFEAAAKQEAAEEAAHIAQAELAEFRRAQAAAKAIADAEAAAERERQIREAALRKAEMARQERMNSGLLLLGAMLAAFALGGPSAPPPSDGTDWDRISWDISRREEERQQKEADAKREAERNAPKSMWSE